MGGSVRRRRGEDGLCFAPVLLGPDVVEGNGLTTPAGCVREGPLKVVRDKVVGLVGASTAESGTVLEVTTFTAVSLTGAGGASCHVQRRAVVSHLTPI